MANGSCRFAIRLCALQIILARSQDVLESWQAVLADCEGEMFASNALVQIANARCNPARGFCSLANPVALADHPRPNLTTTDFMGPSRPGVKTNDFRVSFPKVAAPFADLLGNALTIRLQLLAVR